MIKLRKVSCEDARLLWQWANDPDIRAASFSSQPITWESHVVWLESKLKDKNCLFYAALSQTDIPMGQTRFDISGEDAVISTSIAKEFRGQGYGGEIIYGASQEAFDDSSIQVIHAYVKEGNEASHRVFKKAGYALKGSEILHGFPVKHFVLPRSV